MTPIFKKKSDKLKHSGNTKRFVVFHMRKDPVVCIPEFQNFLQHSGLQAEQLQSINLYEDYSFDPALLDNYSGFFVGGISDDPSDNLQLDKDVYPFIYTLDQLLQKAITDKKPGMLSCGGFMLASALLGGQLTTSRIYREMDIVPIQLTALAQKDPLFRDMPSSFHLVSGHLKSTRTLPKNTTLLASSAACPIHAFKVNNAPIYAFQGHPEMTPQQLKARVEPYKEKYFDSGEQYQQFIQKKTDTSVANSLLKRFVALATSVHS